MGTHRSIHIATVPAHAHPQTSRSRAFSSVVFFTAAGGVYHSLVRRLWCRWFILNKLLSPKKEKTHNPKPCVTHTAHPMSTRSAEMHSLSQLAVLLLVLWSGALRDSRHTPVLTYTT